MPSPTQGGPRLARIVVMAAVVVPGLGGCFPLAAQRLPQEVGAALVEKPMRRLETSDMQLYYPEGRQTEAWRFLTRVEGCVQHLRRVAQVHNAVSDQKIVTLLPELALNNAFVFSRIAGYEALAVVPTYNTLDMFTLEFGLPPDPAVIGCHEITHYVHGEQIAGWAWFWNFFGQVYTPQIGLDAWFHEGLAVYYETKLQPGTGRLAWPFWRGSFAAGFAGRRFNGGDLSALNREFHGGTHYLNGSQFIRFLADRYGEDKLWKLIHVQARSIFFPLWVNLRFWQAYDKTLSTLIDEFADEVATNLPDRGRPADQRVLRPAGNNARYARAPDGTEALLASDLDQPAWLAVYGPDGRLRSRRVLEDVLPPRKLSIAAPMLASGLSFSADARSLYFVALDLDPTYQATRLYRYDVDAGTLAVINRDLRGSGGLLTPDGRRYVFARADGDHHDLAELDIATGAVRVIAREPHGAFIANPRVSPDGTRIVATRFDGQRFRVAVIDARDGRLLSTLRTGDDPVHDALVGGRLPRRVPRGSAGDAGFQVYDCDLDSGRIAKLTNAPFLAFQPNAADGRTLRFLNREGWRWTLDEIALPPRAAPVAPPPPPPAAPIVAEAPAPSAPETPQTPAEAPAPPPADAPDAPPAEASDAPPAEAATATPAPAVPPAPAAAEAPAPPGAVATNVIPTDVTDTPASPIDHLFVPSLYGPTYTVLGRAGAVPRRGAVGRRPARTPPMGARRLLPVHRVRPRRRIVRVLQPAARPADAALAAAQFAFADVPPIRSRHAVGVELHAGAARAAGHLRRAPPLLRVPGVARLRAPRELPPRRSRRC